MVGDHPLESEPNVRVQTLHERTVRLAVRLEALFADIRKGAAESADVASLHPLLHGNETKQDSEIKKAI